MKVLLEHSNTHHYWTEYKKTNLFCPTCGANQVWKDEDPGDYYTGSDYVCVGCNFSHNLDYCDLASEGSIKAGVINQIKTGITAKPTTELGN